MQKNRVREFLSPSAWVVTLTRSTVKIGTHTSTNHALNTALRLRCDHRALGSLKASETNEQKNHSPLFQVCFLVIKKTSMSWAWKDSSVVREACCHAAVVQLLMEKFSKGFAGMGHRLTVSASKWLNTVEDTLTWKNSSVMPRAALVVWLCLLHSSSTTNPSGIRKERDEFLFAAAVSRLGVIQKPVTAYLNVWNRF